MRPVSSRRSSADLVEPPHRGALGSVTEGLELLVPGLAKRQGQLVVNRGGITCPGLVCVTDPVLGDHDIAVNIGRGVEDP